MLKQTHHQLVHSQMIHSPGTERLPDRENELMVTYYADINTANLKILTQEIIEN